MDLTAIVPLASVGLAFAGGALTYLRYRFDRTSRLADERLAAYGGLLATLHVLNNTHLLDSDQDEPDADQLRASWTARDEVWVHLARVKLLAPSNVVRAAEALVDEYMSSAWKRQDRRPVARGDRKVLRQAFIMAAREDLPGVSQLSENASA